MEIRYMYEMRKGADPQELKGERGLAGGLVSLGSKSIRERVAPIEIEIDTEGGSWGKVGGDEAYGARSVRDQLRSRAGGRRLN
jgi:hypothetical protein